MNTYAGIEKRFLALIIDGVVICFLTSAFYIYGLWYFVFLISPLYFILLEGSNMQATLGKKLLGIRVINMNCNKIGYGTAFVRYIGKIVSTVILFIGYLMALFSDTRQALHDKIADTFVVEADYRPNLPNQISNNLKVNPQIIGISGEYAGKSFPISTNGVMMGRDNIACQIIFFGSTPGISRHHCVISFSPQTNMFVLNDIGSSYGTYTANGTRVQSGQPIALKAGERFYLGGKNNMFEGRILY